MAYVCSVVEVVAAVAVGLFFECRVVHEEAAAFFLGDVLTHRVVNPLCKTGIV